jgi:predicted kinase
MEYQKEKDRAQMQGQIAQYELDIENAQAQVESYDKWLENYQGMYDQQMAARNAQAEALKSSGQEAYNNFMNAIGYSDAAAGATGRIGGGTSAGEATRQIDRELVNYAGEDRSLGGYDGLVGEQLLAMNLETDQVRKDLEFQLYEQEKNREIQFRTIEQYKDAISRTRDALGKL